jgi:hypothetical protein
VVEQLAGGGVVPTVKLAVVTWLPPVPRTTSAVTLWAPLAKELALKGLAVAAVPPLRS